MYRYILTRYCLQSGTVTLRPGAEHALELGRECTLEDGARRYPLRVSLPARRLSGLGEFYRDAGLAANDVLLLSPAGEGRLRAEYRHAPRRAAPPREETPAAPPAPRRAEVVGVLGPHVVARRSGEHSAALRSVLETLAARAGLQLGSPAPGLWRLYAPLGARAYDVAIAEDAPAAQAPEFRVAAYPLRLLGEDAALSRPEDSGQRGVTLSALQRLGELLQHGHLSLPQLEAVFADPERLADAAAGAMAADAALERALLTLAPLPAGSLVSADALPGEASERAALLAVLCSPPLSLLDDLGGGELYLRQGVRAGLQAAARRLGELHERLPAAVRG